jgi:5-methylcytosine-specific restriction endonuclease McrA
MLSTLVLNATYEPMSIVNGFRAVNLILSEKAVSVDDSSRLIRSQNIEIFLPHVVKLNYFVKKAHQHSLVPFSRRGVLVRDNFECVYCGRKAETIDHVIPKSAPHYGANSYENCVASCFPCNSKKGNKTLKEAGYVLGKKPEAPSFYSSFLLKAGVGSESYQAWSEYVFMFQPALKETFKVL